MIATRSFRLGTLLTLAMAASLGTSHTALAQATKTETKAKVAKEKAREKAKAAEGPIDLNSATADELQTLPGVGEVTARKIIESRPHKSVNDLAGAGVSASEIAKLKPLVEAKPLPSPVDVNLDSMEKLETLPGIGPAMAREIVGARPIANYDAVAKLKGIGPEKLDALRGRLKFGEVPAVEKVKAKAKAKVEEAKVEEAEAKTKVAEAKAGMPKAKAAAEEVKAKAKVEEAKVEEKAKVKVAEAKEKDIPAPRLAPGTKININTANREDLDKLFDIGEVKAQAIIDYRAEKKFDKIEDIMQVKGIKEGIYAKIKDFITVK